MRQRPRAPSTTALLVEALLHAYNTTIHAVQVGANMGDFSRKHHTRNPADDPARELMLTLLNSIRTHTFLLEPNPPVFEQLQAGLRRHLVEASWPAPPARNAEAKNVAVCAGGRASGAVPFYVVSLTRLLADHPRAPRWVRFGELSSLDKRSVLRGVGLVTGMDNASRYVDEVSVPCLTAPDLLRSLALPAAELDALIVDAEGSDVHIVQSFIDAGARPALVLFEADTARYHSPPATRSLLAQLVRGGYRVYCCGCSGYFPPGFRKRPEEGVTPKPCDAARNALAWDPSRLRLETVAASGKYEWGCAHSACGGRAGRGGGGRRKRPGVPKN